MSSRQIEVKENNLIQLDYTQIKPLQPESFKTLSDQDFDALSESIFTHGWMVPLHVALIDGEYFTLDGHQRLRFLHRLQPERKEYPALVIECTSRKDAAKKLLAIDSKYGKRTAYGEAEFIELFEIEQEYIESVAVMDFGEIEDETPVGSAVKGKGDNTTSQLFKLSFSDIDILCTKEEIEDLKAAYYAYVNQYDMDTGFVKFINDSITVMNDN